jgi:hypothetical protein
VSATHQCLADLIYSDGNAHPFLLIEGQKATSGSAKKMNRQTRASTGTNHSVDWFKRVIDVLTLLIITGGFLLAIDQATKIRESLEESRKTNEFSLWNSVAQQWLGLDRIFVDNEDVRKFIYGNVPITEGHKNYEHVVPVAYMTLDFIDYVISTYTRLIGSNERLTKIVYPEEWKNYFTGIFSTSPIICQLLSHDPESYDPETRKLADEPCKKHKADHG